MDVARLVLAFGNLLFRLNPYAQDQSAVEIAAQADWRSSAKCYIPVCAGVGDAADGNLQRGVETMPAFCLP